MVLNFDKTDGSNYAVYGDPGYANQKYVKVGFKNHNILTQAQKDFNKEMSALRVSVEYGFGKIVQQFAYVDFKKNTEITHESDPKTIFYSSVPCELPVLFER